MTTCFLTSLFALKSVFEFIHLTVWHKNNLPLSWKDLQSFLNDEYDSETVEDKGNLQCKAKC